MSELKKVAVLDSVVEAQVLETTLKQRDIPHVIRPYHDSAYDGLFEGPKGWGHIEVAPEHETEVLALLEDLRTQGSM